MKERIIQVMNAEGLSSSKFAEEIGIQRAAMSHILTERNKPSADVLVKILTRFQDINSEWLMRGIGPMKRNTPAGLPQMKQSALFTNVTVDQSETRKAAASRKMPVPETVHPKSASPEGTPPIVTAVKETFVSAETPSRKITQIMIFFSDHTYEVFHPEKE
ncbi:MAG: helix-turn-helix domain-containing protein [Tannerella sp.]|jgi:transcriptional regulator with XRE-family HTH domain|nr:helix-turn-helix domain-containing protein [Tannerella sp.]